MYSKIMEKKIRGKMLSNIYFDDVRWLDIIGVLLSEGLKCAGRLTITENVALNRGSSKHGYIFRAAKGWKRVVINHLNIKSLWLFSF